MPYVLLMLSLISIDSVQSQSEPSLKKISRFTNRDIILEAGLLGVWPMLPDSLIRELPERTKSPRFQNELIAMLDDPNRYAVAQLVLTQCYGGWSDVDNAVFPGVFGLSIDSATSVRLVDSRKRSKALGRYWRNRLQKVPQG